MRGLFYDGHCYNLHSSGLFFLEAFKKKSEKAKPDDQTNVSAPSIPAVDPDVFPYKHGRYLSNLYGIVKLI
jgi:hypothetical protein